MNFPADVTSCKSIKRSQHILVHNPKRPHNIAKGNHGVKVEKFNNILQREEKCVEVKRFSDILISLGQ
jgi:hypothetical protein